MGHQHGPSQPKRVYEISFLIEKPQTTFCGLGSHQYIHKSPQRPGCPSKEHVHVSASGQARDGLVREEVYSSWTPGHPPQCPFGLFKCTLYAWFWHWLYWVRTASSRSPSLVFPAKQQKLGKYQYLDNFAPWYHVGTRGDHALRLPSITVLGQKWLQAFCVAAARNAAAEHPLHQQREDNPKASGQFKWQGSSLRVVGEAKEKGDTNKT